MYLNTTNFNFRTGWEVVFDGKDGSTDSNILIRGKTLTIRCKGFCRWSWLARCKLDVQIMPFVNIDLLRSKTVGIKVFALTDPDAKVSLPIHF